MNIALGALVVGVLLLPGGAVLFGYYTSFREKKSSIHIPFEDLLLRGIVMSFLIHSAGICILRVFNRNVDFQLLYDVLIGKEITLTNSQFTTVFLEFCAYNIFIIITVFLISKWIKNLVMSRNWDQEFYSLRNTNYWFQLFSARYLEMPGVQGEQEQTDLIYVDILTEQDILYRGLLLDFNYSAHKDELENVILQSAIKRQLHKPENSSESFCEGHPSHIPGDILVIPARTILNVSVSYIHLSNLEIDDPLRNG